jgi:hypothetical protein
MNDVMLRNSMVESAQEMIKSKFHENEEVYKAAYRESIEDVLFLGEAAISDPLEAVAP